MKRSFRRGAVSGEELDGRERSRTGRPATDLAEVWCELVETGRGGRPTVRGQSMIPALHPGWSVAVEPVQPTRLRVGDVAVFFIRSRLVVHRIVLNARLGPVQWLVEKGDAAPHAHRLKAEAVMGRVVDVFDERALRVPPRHWQWSAARRLLVSLVVFHRLAAARVVHMVTEPLR